MVRPWLTGTYHPHKNFPYIHKIHQLTNIPENSKKTHIWTYNSIIPICNILTLNSLYFIPAKKNHYTLGVTSHVIFFFLSIYNEFDDEIVYIDIVHYVFFFSRCFDDNLLVDVHSVISSVCAREDLLHRIYVFLR